MSNMAKLKSLCLLISLIFYVSLFQSAEAESKGPLTSGLSYTFYLKTCPQLEGIIRNYLRPIFQSDIGQAAGLLRFHFHDCFVHGCQGTLLLEGTNSERTAIPNKTLRPKAFLIINELKKLTKIACGNVVSCTDIETLVARDSVYLSGGPDYPVPLGRRDGLTAATPDEVLANLPSPFSNASVLLNQFAQKGFNAIDLVALSGAHTIGVAHCNTFSQRLYPTVDSTMDAYFAASLKRTCPAEDTDATTPLDVTTPNTFDAKYYSNLLANKGLLATDQDLFTNFNTKFIVTAFAYNQFLFYGGFVGSMTKLGQFGVLTGTDGEIRSDCSVVNGKSSFLEPTANGLPTVTDI